MIYSKVCSCGTHFEARSSTAVYCDTCKARRKYEATLAYRNKNHEKTKRQKRESAQRRRGTKEATRPCRRCGAIHTFSSTRFLVCPTCKAKKIKESKQAYEVRHRGDKPKRIRLSEEERLARLKARKDAWNAKQRNIPEAIARREEKEKRRIVRAIKREEKEVKLKDYSIKNTDVPVYKSKSVDIEHRRYTANEKAMIDEFLAKRANYPSTNK